MVCREKKVRYLQKYYLNCEAFDLSWICWVYLLRYFPELYIVVWVLILVLSTSLKDLGFQLLLLKQKKFHLFIKFYESFQRNTDKKLSLTELQYFKTSLYSDAVTYTNTKKSSNGQFHFKSKLLTEAMVIVYSVKRYILLLLYYNKTLSIWQLWNKCLADEFSPFR